MALKVRIQKRAGGFFLDTEFEAPSGATLALLGASGCGKSMTLQCIAGIQRPDRGRIELDGQVLFDSARRVDLPPQRRRVGYLFQHYALFPHMTGAGNIAAGCLHLGRRRRAERVRELTALLRLEGTEDLLPRQMSGGQQQRTALARILASEPRAILLDEPLSALDSALKWKLEQELRDFLDRFPGPALWVSHDLGEVHRSCERICLLECGKSSPVSTVRELMENPGTVSAARLSGCRNLLPVRRGTEAGTVRLPGWGLTLHCAAPWREGVTTLGIRQSALRLAGEGDVNTFSGQVLRVVEDVSCLLAALGPGEDTAEDAVLSMELDRSERAVLEGAKVLQISVKPEELLLLA